MRATENRGATLAALLSRACPAFSIHAITTKVALFQRYQTSLRNIYTAQCNGFRQEGEEARAEKREKSIRHKVDLLCAELGIDRKYNGDPRGCAIYLQIPGTDGDSIAGGWGVYR